MRIPRFRMLCAALSIALASTVALSLAGGGGTALGAATTLTVLSGDVSVKPLADASFSVAADGQTVIPGDAIRTGDGARAVITYFEGSTVTLEPNTILVVDAAETRAGGTVVQMTQLLGRTWHVVTKLVNGRSRYDVRTPASTASVRGTRFLVDARPEHTTITTEEGRVVAAVPSGADVVEVPVAAGMTQTQERGAPPVPARASGSSAGERATPRSTRVARDGARTATRPELPAASVGSRHGEEERATDRRGDARATDERRARAQGPLQPATNDERTFTRRDVPRSGAKAPRGGVADRGRATRAERSRDRRD